MKELQGNANAIVEKLALMSQADYVDTNDALLWLAIEREAQRILDEARRRVQEHVHAAN